MAFASWWYATQGGKNTDGTPKPTDKKSSETAEKKPGTASTSAAAASSTRVPSSQERTMKPADTKPKSTTKTEPAKPTQTTVPKTTTATSKSSTTTSSTVKPSTEKVTTKQDVKKAPQKQKSDSTLTSGVVGKAAAASVVATSKPKDGGKQEKKTADPVAAASTTGDKDALDLLSDSLGGPDTVPESPKFTGPEIADTLATSEHLAKLGERDSTIPPEYRHLLDGKGEKPAPPPEDTRKSLGDDDLVAAFSSDFVSSQAPPEEKKPKLEEPKSAAQKSTEKVTTKQEVRAAPQKQKPDSTVSSGAVGKAAAAPVVSTSKPKEEAIKEKKSVTVQQVAAAPATKSETDDALDLLIDSLGGPETVPESPKFTGPEIADTPVTSEHLERLGDRDSAIPPEYRHLLDGKGEKPFLEEARKSLGDEDLVAAFSSDFVSCQAPPEEKKPKLDEIQKKEAKSVSSGPSAPTQPSTTALSDEALDELLGTLEGPPTHEPESPQYTGPEVTETITRTYLEELGKRDSAIPPEYRHLLDGKEDGKPAPPPAPLSPPISDASLVDEFSKDFETCISPAAVTTPAFQPKDAARDKQAKSDVVVRSAASSVQAAAAPTAPSAGMDSAALDELMGTLEGPEFNVPESPVYTGPEVTETRTATHIEELGKRESTIPPAYRHLLDGKEDGKPVLPTPEEKPLSESELVDAFDLEFASPQPPAAQQTPPVKPKDAAEVKESEAEAVVSSKSSALQAAPAPSKAPAGKVDPHDALARTLVSRKEDPKDKKPAADKVKEKTSKENKEKLGEDEETIPPDYRLQEVKDKDGKPLLPKPEEKPKAMSEDELLDALSEGFDTTPVPAQCAPLQSSAKAPGKPQSEEVVSCSKASAVQSAGKPSASIPDDALDMLSGSLGERQPDPDDNKPLVDVVKEKMKEEHIHKPGETDGSIPPEYRHLLDGKEQGKPAKPEAVKPKDSLDDNAAIDQLSCGFASCDTGTTDKTQNSSKDKVEKSSSSTPVSRTSGKETSKDKVEKSSSVQKTETPGKVPDSSKATSQSSLEKPSAQKTGKR